MRFIGKENTFTQLFHMSFFDDIGTDLHWLPWSGSIEMSNSSGEGQKSEEVAMVMPFSGRVASCVVRTASLGGTNTNLGLGIVSSVPGADIVGSGWVEQEIEVMAVNSSDANHVFNYVFSNSKHFNKGDALAIYIQSSADIANANSYWYVTSVVEFNLDANLGNVSKEFDSVQ